MTDMKSTISKLVERVDNFSKISYELFKLETIGKSADVMSSLISRLVIIIVVALLILIFNIGIALWLGELLGKSYYCFFAIAGVYLIVSFLLHLFQHQWIKRPISDAIIIQMLKEKQHEKAN